MTKKCFVSSTPQISRKCAFSERLKIDLTLANESIIIRTFSALLANFPEIHFSVSLTVTNRLFAGQLNSQSMLQKQKPSQNSQYYRQQQCDIVPLSWMTANSYMPWRTTLHERQKLLMKAQKVTPGTTLRVPSINGGQWAKKYLNNLINNFSFKNGILVT